MAVQRREALIDYATEILNAEADAIRAVAPLLDERFESAVRLICDLQTEGRVVVSGMGKAGFVGMKISATFASTGTPSFFLHPAEAVHGDLGRTTKRDIALVLSNSGETGEVIKLLPYLARVGCSLISITGNPRSTLSKRSDISLSIGAITEAGPCNLAPTTSTTAMLALGDALAMTVLSRKPFSPEQFALYHPGGSLGRALLTVEEIMRRGAALCVVPEEQITRRVLAAISETQGRPGAAAIVNKKGHLVGVFTDGDLRRCLASGEQFLDAPIATVMSIHPKTVEPSRLAQEAFRILHEHKIDQIIVMNKDGTPVGLVDIQDLFDVSAAEKVG